MRTPARFDWWTRSRRPRGRLVCVLAVAVVLVLTGCTVPTAVPGENTFGEERELGQIGEIRYDDTFGFETDGALTQRELEAVTYRTMARIEVLRGLQFTEDVEVEVVSRETYRTDREDRSTASAVENEVYRGAFLVDGETDVNAAIDALYGEAVVGYYADGRIVLVTAADEIRIDRTTLVHELVHALQDQHFGLEYAGETIDERLAETGLIEGEAEYLPHLYDERCDAEWECLPSTRGEPVELDPGTGNVALFLSIYAPYSEGVAFVEDRYETGGWEAVDRVYGAPPMSTSQLIHPERYPDVVPVDIEVEDRSGSGWSQADAEGRETIGEATLFATFWANGVIDRSLTDGTDPPSPYNYSHPVTSGWTGDTLAVYETADGDEHAHVWELAWETPADAERFADAYRDLLAANGAESLGGGVYTIDDGGHEGAYRVTVVDGRVTVVGAPTTTALEDVHATPETAEAGVDPIIPGPEVGAESVTALGSS